jgi:hypothetical protein
MQKSFLFNEGAHMWIKYNTDNVGIITIAGINGYKLDD